MRHLLSWRLTPIVSGVALLAACADGPSTVSPGSAVLAGLASRAPSATVVGGPNLSDFLSFQGEIWICKDGNVPGVTFDFDYNVVRLSDGALVAVGSTTVPVGQCVMATNISTQISARYRATATETTTRANWSLTAIDWAYGANLPATPAAPTINLATKTISAVLVANDVGVQLTFTNQFTPPPPTGQIGDYVWNDVNGNGIQESGEPGIAGVTVTLGGAASATTTTNANGAYLFSGLSAGSYTVTVGTPVGYAASPSNQGGDPTMDSNYSPASVTLATDNSIDLSIDFGYTRYLGQIGDYVWNDVNGNGIQDSGEPGIAGVIVTLGGASSATTTTDANGAYLFSGLAAGSYSVTAATPSGYTATLSLQGADRSKDSNGSPASVTLVTNTSTDLTIDFGYVLPTQGCTYTQGYWKTHSEFGPAPYDARWALLPNGASTAFFLSGKTWIQVFNTPPAGNAYYNLSHQYMAARLNVLSGANSSAVTAALASATTLLNTHTPAQVAALSKSSSVRAQFISLSSTLDQYNNGLIGPGHC